MKVGLNVPKNIGGKVFPAGCVVDLFDHEALALIESGEGSAVVDGTMARKKAYGVPGCVPPPEPSAINQMAEFFTGLALHDAKQDNGDEGTVSDSKQKTNTLKK